ncbi:unnamed protein product (macronuclear) [Paramecium tetraurelia]|uniref:Uncharacterized protein n=1 Tax=Paramecium tetraurelia TaxID=5888 RepID=A0BJV5_PARTE|nr:uncharacterized protein GSPATT00029451001 [Paramecium tetraurelia]CAK58822.1 unnamed protein product [Paramecium tetraurelia]|eukprot:XP_001426220.1 hypothetical protein (macronuclear) [Paramecium tetraurelia strain d4-2]
MALIKEYIQQQPKVALNIQYLDGCANMKEEQPAQYFCLEYLQITIKKASPMQKRSHRDRNSNIIKSYNRISNHSLSHQKIGRICIYLGIIKIYRGCNRKIFQPFDVEIINQEAIFARQSSLNESQAYII